MEWGAANKIASGYPGGTFKPDQNVTREQLATFLYSFAKFSGVNVSIGEDTNILSYNDALTISEYAIPAIQWACGAGVLSGSSNSLLPRADATRAQFAVMAYSYSMLCAAALLMLVCGFEALVAGYAAARNSADPDNASDCIAWAVIVALLGVGGVALNAAATGSVNVVNAVFSVVIPALYGMKQGLLAKRNSKQTRCR